MALNSLICADVPLRNYSLARLLSYMFCIGITFTTFTYPSFVICKTLMTVSILQHTVHSVLIYRVSYFLTPYPYIVYLLAYILL